MAKNKLYITAISCSILFSFFNCPAIAENNSFEDLDSENNQPIETKDIGVYLLSRIVDSVKGEPLEKVEITVSGNKTFSDENGEFLIKVNPDDFITFKLNKYKETTLKVSSIKGKIKLDLIPDYLPIFPNLSGNINYRNIGFNESYSSINSSGRFNDSFGIDISGKIYSVMLGAGYDSMGGILNRSQTQEKATISVNNLYLRGGYAFTIIPDILEIAPFIKGKWVSNNITNTVINEDEPRDKDYLDFSNSKLGLGIEAEVAARPIRYNPLVLGGFVSYYPLVSVSQDIGGTLPSSLNGLDFGLYARYDIAKIFIQAKYVSNSLFANNFSSNNSGLILGVGYGF